MAVLNEYTYRSHLGEAKEKAEQRWNEDTLDPLVLRIKRRLRTFVQDRWDFDKMSDPQKQYIMLAALLGSRVKNYAIWREREISYAALGVWYKNMCFRNHHKAEPNRQTKCSPALLMVNMPREYSSDEEDEGPVRMDIEWKQWRKAKVKVDFSQDVLQLWTEHARKFELVSKVARIVLATPATEALCERRQSA